MVLTGATTSPPASTTAELFRQVGPWLGLLLGFCVLAFIALMLVRRSLRRADEEPPDGFSLHGLRKLHARGEMSDEEFEKARAAIIGAAKRSDATRPPVRRKPPDPVR